MEAVRTVIECILECSSDRLAKRDLEQFCAPPFKGSAIALDQLWLLSLAPEHTHSLYPGGHPIPHTFSLAYSATETSSHFLESLYQLSLMLIILPAWLAPSQNTSAPAWPPGSYHAMWSESLLSGSWYPPQHMPCLVICLLSCVLSVALLSYRLQERKEPYVPSSLDPQGPKLGQAHRRCSDELAERGCA